MRHEKEMRQNDMHATLIKQRPTEKTMISCLGERPKAWSAGKKYKYQRSRVRNWKKKSERRSSERNYR